MKRAKVNFCQSLIKRTIGKAIVRSEAREARVTKARNKMCHAMVLQAAKIAVGRSEDKKGKVKTGRNSKTKTDSKKRKYEQEEVENEKCLKLKKI